MDQNSYKFSSNDFEPCKTQSCSCNRCKRMRRFKELLDRLSSASKAINYEEQISSTVATICDVYIQ